MIGVVLVLSLLCLLNLVFTLGVIRRLREHTTILGTLAGAAPEVMHSAGTTVDDFTPEGVTLVGFFSPDCQACHERLPEFVTRARQMPGGRDRVRAFVVGDPGSSAELRDALTDHAVVTVEEKAGAMTKAFGVRGFPAFALVGTDGVVVASGADFRSITLPVAA